MGLYFILSALLLSFLQEIMVGAIRTRCMSPTQKERRANLSSTIFGDKTEEN